MIAFFSQELPPNPNGNAVMLHRLLYENKVFEYCLISFYEEKFDNKSEELSAEKFFLHSYVKPTRFILYSILRSFFRVFLSIYRLCKLIKHKKIQCLVICTGDLITFPVGCISAKLSSKPYVLYMFDDYTEQFSGLRGKISRMISKYILTRASSIIVPNEFVKEKLERQFSIRCIIVRNPVRKTKKQQIKIRSSVEKECNILYTGAIYGAQEKAIIDLISVIEDDKKTMLNIFTSSQNLPDQIKSSKKVKVNGFISQEKLAELHSKNDILFLPLSKKEHLDSVIMTAAPGKMGEYLSSGKPILAYVPKDSFVDYFLRKHKAALVCNDIKGLKKKLDFIVYKKDQIQNIVSNALELSKEFSAELNKDRLNNCFKEIGVLKK